MALLLSPAMASAQDPDRLNGTFSFQDKGEEIGNTLEFQIDGREIGIEGQVRDLAAEEVVTIRYRTDFPSKSAGSVQKASVAQDRQVLITLVVEEIGNPTPIYDGQTAPMKCKAQAKIQGAGPNKSKATLTCDLGRDWDELQDGLAAPPPDVLDAVEAAFAGRKDVKADPSSGKLQIKHNGEPVPVP